MVPNDNNYCLPWQQHPRSVSEHHNSTALQRESAGTLSQNTLKKIRMVLSLSLTIHYCIPLIFREFREYSRV